MRYDVTYVAGNDEQTARVEAISTEHPEDQGSFELLAVVRVPPDEPAFATET